MTIDIDAIRKLTDAADPGPWTAHPDGLVWSQLIGDPVSGSTEVENAEFIAAARTHVPALCDEVDQLLAELDRVRADLAAAHNHAHRQDTNLQQIARAKDELAAERDALKAKLAEADLIIASMRLTIDEADEAEVAR